MTLDTFDLELRRAVTVKMRADVPTNSCTNKLKTKDDRRGSPPHPQDMAAANRTLSCEKNETASALMNSLSHHDSVRIYLSFHATFLSKPSRNSERSASVATPGFPYPAQAFDHAVEQRSVAIHPSQCSSEINRRNEFPAWVRSGSDLLQNAFHKNSSVCSWSGGSPNVLFPFQHGCHFHQLESS